MSPGATPATPPRAVLGVALGALCISFSPILVKAIDPDALGPTAIGLHRVALGALVLAIAARLRGESFAFSRAALLPAIGAGLVFAGDLFTWHRSILGVGAGMSTILGNTQVIWVGLWGALVLQEAGGRRLWTSIGLAATGVVLMSGVLAPEGAPRADAAGFLWGVATGIFYASYILLLRRARTRPGCPGPAALMTWVSAFSAAFLLVVVAIEGATIAVGEVRTLAALLGLALLVQGLGWVVLSVTMPRVPAAVGGLVLLLQPTLATVWGAIFYGERLRGMELVGGALVLLGVYLGTTTPRRRPAGTGVAG